jgi:hypothetical protein
MEEHLLEGTLLGYLPDGGRLEVRDFLGNIMHVSFCSTLNSRLRDTPRLFLPLIGRRVTLTIGRNGQCSQMVAMAAQSG